MLCSHLFVVLERLKSRHRKRNYEMCHEHCHYLLFRSYLSVSIQTQNFFSVNFLIHRANLFLLTNSPSCTPQLQASYTACSRVPSPGTKSAATTRHSRTTRYIIPSSDSMFLPVGFLSYCLRLFIALYAPVSVAILKFPTFRFRICEMLYGLRARRLLACSGALILWSVSCWSKLCILVLKYSVAHVISCTSGLYVWYSDRIAFTTYFIGLRNSASTVLLLGRLLLLTL